LEPWGAIAGLGLNGVGETVEVGDGEMKEERVWN